MKTLFIGGIANGKIIDVPDKYVGIGKRWRVMEPIGFFNRILFLLGNHVCCPLTQTYECETVAAFDAVFLVFVDRASFKNESDIQMSIDRICVKHVMSEIGAKEVGDA